MTSLFPENDIKLEDLFLEVKYDGPSFDGVMNIQDLGNELLGIEYCLTKIINELVKTNKELSEADIESLQILTEGFVNNCFKKKIKFKAFLDEIEKRPVLISILFFVITIYSETALIQININNTNTVSMLRSGQIPIGQYQQIKDLPIPDNAKEIIRSNLIDKKYREESAKIVMPLKNDNDNLELSSSVLEESVIIDNTNKQSFFIIDLPTEQEQDVTEEIKTIQGRINSINLDATKNQIGFKVKNEGNEIHCHLSENLSIDDYKSNYLGEWVEITGKISRAGDIIKEIEIEKLKKITKLGQIDITFGDNR
ncbi:hypothetical protein [bacterium endosymbiont of Bathymodiolus sp. 5 South]|jgi:hypothetical protein|uniref:hypothetical protein n=1 Tax=bacterium endosymbiont of Bathymodiolus sp. 5 South TaxID=1181670 RepID=UPI0010B76849|nr:hypothetical protein [bacterium endosymbiont of Bathymodiolus sp. 5 South]SHN91227.1 hypothetical protein BCLUESOX_1538 [bacterium endosymbiont of Bathymodiolus sp. 5 South]